jgi:hypothetical protein
MKLDFLQAEVLQHSSSKTSSQLNKLIEQAYRQINFTEFSYQRLCAYSQDILFMITMPIFWMIYTMLQGIIS